MLIYAAYLLIWPLTVSPILTVLIYHFRMHRTLADSKLLRRLTHRSVMVYDVIGDFHCPFLNIFFHGITPENVFYNLCFHMKKYAGFPQLLLWTNLFFMVNLIWFCRQFRLAKTAGNTRRNPPKNHPGRRKRGTYET